MKSLSIPQNQILAINPLVINDQNIDDKVQALYLLATDDQEIVIAYLDQLKQPIKKVNKDISEVGEYQKRLSDKEQILKNTLAGYQSPLGSIPIGIDDATFFFPIVVLFGFLVCLRLLKEAMELRQEVHSIPAFKPDKIGLVAPLWIDPESPHRMQHIQLAIFLIPSLISVIVIGINFYMWSFETIPETGLLKIDYFLEKSIKTILYLIAMAIFIFGAIHIQRMLKKYHPSKEWQGIEQAPVQEIRYTPMQLVDEINNNLIRVTNEGLVSDEQQAAWLDIIKKSKKSYLNPY